ncbi:hypothetical protein K469DRAFT_547628, partial [Zopfia rhizophila CBS 207.26]
VRLSLMITVLEFIARSITCTLLRDRCSKRTAEKLSTTLYHNALQLSTVIILLAIVLYKRNNSDWFHMQFALHNARNGGWSTALADIGIPGWFPKKMFQFPDLIDSLVRYLLNMDVYGAQLDALNATWQHRQ